MKHVSREGFASLYGNVVKKIRCLSAFKAEVKSSTDGRGCHSNRRNKSVDIIESTDEYVRSFHFKIAHYENCEKNQEYLFSLLYETNCVQKSVILKVTSC